MERVHPTSRRVLSLIAYLGMALALAYIVIHRYTPSLNQGTKAPLEGRITTINGAWLPLSGLKKPLVMNFWATWCQPCQAELPVLSGLAKKYKNRITFVGAAVNSAKADIISTKNSLGLNYIIGQVDDQIVNLWQAQVLPTTYLVDTTGRIVWSHAGIVSEEELEKNLVLLIKK